LIHLGDITKISGYDAHVVYVIIGGSPCQDLSVAGKRAGLAGERSGLYMEQIRIVKEMREADVLRGRTAEFIRPRYMVWENVPGAFSSNGGKDFAAVIEEIIKICEPDADVQVCVQGVWTKSGCYYSADGRWSIAWRVHDAQFWGVPQRRKRIALVADLGGLSAPEILFERKGVHWNTEKGGEKRKETTGNSGEGIGGAGKSVVYGIGSYHSNAMKSDNPNSGIYEAEISKTIDALNCGYPGCNQGGMAVVEPLCIEMTSTKNTIIEDGVCPTLTARMGTGGNQVNAVLEQIINSHILNDQGGQQISVRTDGKCPTLRAETHGNIQCTLKTIDRPAVSCVDVGFFNSYEEQATTLLARMYKDPPIVNKHIVRRLTPLECERLQGFPDGWTDIGDWIDSKGKTHKASDSPRYKALGNSIALPYWKVLLKRISAQYDRDATMASLFDGIGGFPYIWEQLNGKGSCLWASEIEEFPMAVTKVRFL
jgi:DNA (cytosine-5)-methyltransferase 1